MRARERRQVELGEFDRAGLAAVEARNEVAIGSVPMDAIERALLDQKGNPLLVAVMRYEGMIEIEYGEDVGAQRRRSRQKLQ